MTDPTDKRIEELRQYIPPYTTPNHPPQVEVITTINTGDTPMTEEDPDLLAGDNLDRLRGRNLTEELENARYQNNLLTEECRELEKERDEARRLLKAVVDMMRDNMAPDATHPKHVCDFIYCPEIATCMVCENWTDALVMCYPDDFQDEEETK